MFFLIQDTDIASYANDKTPYVSADNIDAVIKSLKEVPSILFKWFSNNLMKSTVGKCHFLVSTNNTLNKK